MNPSQKPLAPLRILRLIASPNGNASESLKLSERILHGRGLLRQRLRCGRRAGLPGLQRVGRRAERRDLRDAADRPRLPQQQRAVRP